MFEDIIEEEDEGDEQGDVDTTTGQLPPSTIQVKPINESDEDDEDAPSTGEEHDQPTPPTS